MTKLDKSEINDHIKHHAIRVEDWPHRPLAEFLHEWAERFNVEFDLQIVTPAIQIERLQCRAYGTYRRTRNGFGLAHEITFNTKHLQIPVAALLGTLLHELLHEWQSIHGKATALGSGNYHNAEFIAKARSFGLIVDEKGHTRIGSGPFTELLEKHGVQAFPTTPETPVATPKKSKLVKWSCGCTNVRVAVELQAGCYKCGNIFKPAAASW